MQGKTFTLGEREVTLAALTLAQARELHEKILAAKGVTAFSPEADVDAALDIIHASLTRGQAGISRDELLGLVDLLQVNDMLRAVLGLSGFRQGEAAAPAGS